MSSDPATNTSSPSNATQDSILRRWRPPLWEDDFSKNTLDEEPFFNGPPVTSYAAERFPKNSPLVPAQLLAGKSLHQMISRDPFPIPNDQDREGYHGGNDIAYWLSGLGDFLKVMQVVEQLGIEPNSIFEFGCASGRVIRHFCTQTDISEIWASDINRRHIRWLSQFMPRNLMPFFNSAMPSLPLSDSSLDLICAFSVFTHIDTFETAWMAELRRVLRPGGVCYLTIHNEDTWEALRELDDSNRLIKSMIDTGRFSIEQLEDPMPGERLVYRFSPTGPYRSQVFHSTRYVENVWGRFFDLHQVWPRHHGRQSVVVMTKPNVAAQSRLRATA